MGISRYKNFKGVIVTANKKRLASFPSIAASELIDPSDIIVRIQDGERLDKIAFDYLGDGTYWWAICMLNDISLPFGTQVLPGMLLRIPTDISRILNKIQQRANRV